jgi:hypothetical protein
MPQNSPQAIILRFTSRFWKRAARTDSWLDGFTEAAAESLGEKACPSILGNPYPFHNSTCNTVKTHQTFKTDGPNEATIFNSIVQSSFGVLASADPSSSPSKRRESKIVPPRDCLITRHKINRQRLRSSTSELHA